MQQVAQVRVMPLYPQECLIMWIPGTVYKALPALYVAAGAGLIAAFGWGGVATLSAMLFFAAATTTLLWRFQHRADPPPPVDKAREAWAERRARRDIPH